MKDMCISKYLPYIVYYTISHIGDPPYTPSYILTLYDNRYYILYLYF